MAGLTLTIDLPMPPSVNRIWRSRHSAVGGKPSVYLDRKYSAWRRECDALCIANRWNTKPIKGGFSALITIDETRRRKNSDLDNLCKAPLDFLQRVGIIEDDKLASVIVMHWGEAPLGCRVTVNSDSEAESLMELGRPTRSKPVLGWPE